MYVPIEQFAIPSDISIFGSHFGQHTYYASFAGLAKKYQPQDILEIGVRFGYSGIAMCLGALAGGRSVESLEYHGIDACYFSHPDDPSWLSNDVAREHFQRMVPGLYLELHRYDTRRGLPEEVNLRLATYDLINVDGDHSFEGCYRDLGNIWPLATPGALVVVDDVGMEDVRRAISLFSGERLAAGELAGFQWYQNERGWAILQKVADQ